MAKRIGDWYNAAFASLGCGGIIAFFVTIWFIVAKMFEYSLWSIFGKDVPWYLDLLGGLVLNGLNFPVFVLCLIGRAMGFEVPFFEG